MKKKMLVIGKEFDFIHFVIEKDEFIEGRGTVCDIGINGMDGFKIVTLRTDDYEGGYIHVYASALDLTPEEKEEFKVNSKNIKQFVIDMQKKEDEMKAALDARIYTPKVKRMQAAHEKKKNRLVKDFNRKLQALQFKLHGYHNKPTITAPKKADK